MEQRGDNPTDADGAGIADRHPARAMLGITWVGDCQSSIADEIEQTTELGPVRVTTVLSPAEPTVGDQIQLEIRVTYAADVDVLMPEFGEALNRYTILGLCATPADCRRWLHAVHAAVYAATLPVWQTVHPPHPGRVCRQSAGKPPSPEDADAYEILTERIDFNVKSVLPTTAAAELKPPLGRLEPR